jgi:hypothetical protein
MAVNKVCPSRISWEFAGTAADKETAKQKRRNIHFISTSKLFCGEPGRLTPNLTLFHALHGRFLAVLPAAGRIEIDKLLVRKRQRRSSSEG